MLAKFAVLVDYYECSESVDLAVSVWIADLRTNTPIPATYCRDLVLWIWISWTFKLSDLFERATAVAIRQSTELVQNLGLPIPGWITDRLVSRRYRAMEAIVSGLSEQIYVYRSASYICPMSTAHSLSCGGMLMGTLTKQMHSLDLTSSQLGFAFSGQTFDDLCMRARSIRSETWYHSNYNPHRCTLGAAIVPIVDLAVTMVVGLDLRDESA
ncbi:hypothetical protein OPT61_g3174 [Boeremia exigua]|uniref:Uncharacterized protein n=1 Tax=Boeremia exigua TaxID=749465 RepID=A0ACC2IIV4_9PLEO|nr:hypothetical protein OPT61_g3174 [Boeremia exigua]